MRYSGILNYINYYIKYYINYLFISHVNNNNNNNFGVNPQHISIQAVDDFKMSEYKNNNLSAY